MYETAASLLPSLIGTRWERGATGPDAYDCWSFAALLQDKLKGRTLPLAPVLELDTTDTRAVIEAIRTSPLQREWMPVPAPGHGDLVLMRRHSGASHCGVWIDEGPLVGIAHCARHAGVMLQSAAQMRVQYRELEYRRPATAMMGMVSKGVEPALKSPLDPGHALVVIVRHPEQPLLGADLIAALPGQSPADILNDHLELVGHPADQCWMFHNTDPLLNRHPETGEDEWLTRQLEAGDVLWIAPIPPAGDDSNIFATIAAIALAVVAPYLAAGLGGAFVTAAGGLSLAGNVLAAGIALGGNLLISALVGPSGPQAPEALESPSPTYTLSPPGNQLRPGGQIPWIVGTVRRQPDLLARPYGQFADNEQLFYTLLGVGIGRYRINEIGIGDTAVWTPAGLTGALDDVTIEILEPGERVTLFPADVQTNVEVGGQVMPAAEVDEAAPASDPPVLVETIVGPFVAVAAGTTSNRIECDFAFPRGLFEINDEGETKDVEVTWRTEVRLIDDAGAALAGWQAFPARTVKIGTTTPLRETSEFPVIEGRYEVQVVRMTSSEVDNARGQDELVWAGLKAYIPGDETFDDVTAIAIKARATETSSQAQRTWYVDATRILPRWDGTAWVEEPTEAIEAAILEAATAEIGLGYAEADVDMDALQRLAATWGPRGDVCCLVIDTARGVWDVLEAVAAPGRTKPQMIGNQITFMRDEPRPFPTQIITHADITRGSLSISRSHFTREKPNAIRARYWDRAGLPAEVECIPPGISERRFASIEFPGIVDHDHCFREGITVAAANNLRRTYANFTMLEAGRSLRIGELVALSHPRPKYGRPGRVVTVDWPVLELSEPHGAEENAPLHLRLSMPSGGHWGPVLVVAGSDPYIVTVDTVDFALVLSQHESRSYAADARLWIITESTLEAPDADAVEVIAGRQVEPTRSVLGPDVGGGLFEGVVMGVRPRPDGSVEVLCVREDAGVHTAETGIVPALPPQSGLSRLAGAPVWSGARAEVSELSGTPIVNVAGLATPGAVRYILDYSTNGEDWVRAADAASPTLEASVPSDATLQLRFAAVGQLRGPWVFQTVDTSAPAYGLAAVVGLGVVEAPKPAYRFNWQADAAVTGWYGTLYEGSTALRTFSVTVPYFDYSEALQVQDGGPFRQVRIELQATRGAETSEIATFEAGAAAPYALATPTVLNRSDNSATLSTFAHNDPSVRGYRFAITASNGDPENPITFVDTDTSTLDATLTGLLASTGYHAFVAAFDASRTDLNWSPFTALTTTSGA